ncbi:MAG: type IV secretory system conjugative DNA transfer family protein [Alphaproteobacteria bacterium]|nr:type IV secretory system conjugative DNA transfer family protein [Alphaproteobacteria bacterium]
MIDNENNRFGSASFASEQDVRKAGMFDQHSNSLLIGFYGHRPVWYSGMGGLLLVAGARGGKLRDVLAYNICRGICLSSMVILDMKGELAVISQGQELDGKIPIYWNPCGLHGMPQHRINPVDYIRIDSPSLVSDTKVFCENKIAVSGSPNADYFERRAQEFLEAMTLTLAEKNGTLTLPDLYRVINLIPGGTDEWLNFAYDMSRSCFPVAMRIEEEIASSRNNPTNGFQGILGELFKGFACLSDPQLLSSVSPPYDFSFSQPCEGDQKYQAYFMPRAEFVESWSPVLKDLFVAAMIYKSRKPQAPQQTWVIDEAAQLNKFPLIVKLYTYGAGIGIRPWAVFQSTKQMKSLGHEADNIITSSAALRSYFAVRDIETASSVSRMIGAQTLVYEDEHAHARARHAKRQAVQAFLSGDDPLSAGLNYAHHAREAETPHMQHRQLRNPDEVLNTPADKQYIFADGLPGVLYGDRKPYYQQRFMKGRYSDNPYY